MKRYLYPTGALLLVLAVGIGIARAEFPRRYAFCMRGGPGGFPLAFITHELDLTSAQQTQIKSIWVAERPTITLVRQLLSDCNEMSLANSNGDFDEVKARAAADKEAGTISSLLVERQRMMTKVYNEVLTPEQRTKADQLRERMHGRIEGFLDGLENSTD
jgi:Spy/CpxP family protein refolding chaperone